MTGMPELIRKPLVWIASALLLAIAAVACGSEAAPTAAPTTAPQPAATTVAANPAPESEVDRTGWPEKVRLGLIPTEANVITNWAPIVEHLEARLGLEVEPFVGTDYTATIIAARNGDLDIVWLGPKSYVTAREQGADMEPVVKWINDDTGIAGYNSLLISHRDTGIKNIEDAQGRTFAFNDPESTSGFLVPSVFFLERDIDPESYFSDVFFAGSHEATALAVANGNVDLASNNNETLPRLIETGRIAEEDITIVWESPLIPTDPISVQNSLPQSFHDSVREAFLQYDDPAGLDALQIQGWIPAADADYEVIRTLEATKAALASTDDVDKTGWPAKVRLGLIPTEANVITNWEPVVSHLEIELGVEVEPFVGTDYTATIIAARNGNLDIVWLGPKSYVKAREQGADMEPVVKWINEDTGIAGYNSMLITHKDTGINTIADAQGRSFAFNDPESTSGFLVPTVYFLERGIVPESYFSDVFFAGSHEATALAVANNNVDLASNNNETLPRLFETGKVSEDDIRIIWESPLIPTDPISVQNSLPESFHTAVTQAFLKFDDPAALDALQIQGWIPAEDGDYEVIRTLEATKAQLASAN